MSSLPGDAGAGTGGELPTSAYREDADLDQLGMTVSELAERSGVGVPSIHHYRRLGLLPDPVMVSANRFHYDERHVEALRMIRLLRERRGMALAAIRDVLPDLLAGLDRQAFEGQVWDAVLPDSDAGADAHHEIGGQLLDAARAAFVARGYGGVNVEQLCQQVGIAKGSFYRHFDSKEALFEAAARSSVEVVGGSVAGWRRAMTVDSAVDAVAGALEPLVPLLLEVAVRAFHGDRALADVVPDVVAGIGELVDPHLPPASEAGGGTGIVVAERALGVVVGRALGLDASGAVVDGIARSGI